MSCSGIATEHLYFVGVKRMNASVYKSGGEFLQGNASMTTCSVSSVSAHYVSVVFSPTSAVSKLDIVCQGM